ncbi:MFS family permease [Microbacterium phyllosphaerae]|uniref:MFS family permease n=1 Tax=Microbacterium phyllosphaerae TaxID=124798 RepID=A0ABS4WKD6_9MICO|nr:MFS transporter [Microbacterium phyllosphaerae]MBP2376667.1 MFS family permease [Microbacterium phyllosphaerae]
MTSTPPLATPRLAPLYLAGFITAFGAHGIAAALGAETEDIGWTLLAFGLTLALYDLAEVLLKPFFGALSDRVGVRPVIVGGLLAFSAFSVVGAVVPGMLGLVIGRFGQGAAASAFSPSSSAAVARLTDDATRGKYFGRYGSWKSLGYALGPLLGAVLVVWGGMPALFWALAVLGLGAAVWVAVAVPAVPVLPRTRVTLVDLGRELTAPGFVVPTLVLAATTGALAVAVGFLPLLGRQAGLDTVWSMAIVTVLALASSVTQPFVGAVHDRGRISVRLGTAGGLALIAAGIALAAVTQVPVALVSTALLVGVGVGVATPIAFSYLASSTPPQRMGRTMGSAELGRELGDAGGPLVAGAVATASVPGVGLGVVAALTAGAGALALVGLRRRSGPDAADEAARMR